MKWYVIYTKRREEQRALHNLQQQGFHCYLPMIAVQRNVRGKVRTVPEPLFPRYLFIQLDPDGAGTRWSPLRSTRGVVGLVKFGTWPAVVDGELVEFVRKREVGSSERALFDEGQRVRVSSGAFSGIEGVFMMTDGERRGIVLIELLQKSARLPVRLHELEPVS